MRLRLQNRFIHKPVGAQAIAALTAALILTAALAAGLATAGSCRTFLALGEVRAHPAPGNFVMDVYGDWEFDNLIQVGLGVSINLVVIQGDEFVRYPFGGTVETGILTGLEDDLTLAKLPALEATGATATVAEIMKLTPDHIQIKLPGDNKDGLVTVVMYLVQNGSLGTAFISNSLSTYLEGDENASSVR